MSKPVLHLVNCQSETNYLFYCPGCKETHMVRVAGPKPPVWGWNGDIIKPTFTPSLLLRGGHFSDMHKPEDSCWCTYNAEHPDDPSPFKCVRCHTFVTNGMIQFLQDCSHELAGQTVPLPPWDESY